MKQQFLLKTECTLCGIAFVVGIIDLIQLMISLLELASKFIHSFLP